jgi:P pilus assembly chaperone PapD
MKTTIIHLALLLAVLLGGSHALLAQFEVAPTRIMLSMRDRSKEVNVANTTDGTIEVNVDLGYKVIRTDSLGTMTLDSASLPEERAKSGQEWLKIYPKRFTLAPHSSRMLRVMVVIPDSAKDGEYWGRVIVTSTPVAAIPTTAADTINGIQTNLSMRLQLDLPVIIRKGAVETGIVINAPVARQTSEGTLLLFDMQRVGNSAYRGTVSGTIKQSDGTEVARAEEQYTVEFALRKRLLLPKLQDGSYVLVIESQSVKKGGANEAVIPAPTVTQAYDLTVTGARVSITPKK